MRPLRQTMCLQAFIVAAVVGLLCALLALGALAAPQNTGPATPEFNGQTPSAEDQGKPLLYTQTDEEVMAKSSGCQSCHTPMDSVNMHAQKSVRIGCTDCHGGDSGVSVTAGTAPNSATYNRRKKGTRSAAGFSKKPQGRNRYGLTPTG